MTVSLDKTPIIPAELDAEDLDACAAGCVCPFVITDADGGSILARFDTMESRDEALLTGDYPDDAEPAYVNVFGWW